MTDQTPTSDDKSKTWQQQRRFVRECALQLLYQRDAAQEWNPDADIAERFWEELPELTDTPSDWTTDTVRENVHKLVQGVTDKRLEIDRQLEAITKNWRLDRMSTIDRNIIRLAAFEILYRQDIPPVVATNEAIELAKQYGDRDSTRFVNGILDKLLKQKKGNPP